MPRNGGSSMPGPDLSVGERDLDFRPAGRWGPSYVGRVRSSAPVEISTLEGDQTEWSVAVEGVGPLRRRWPLPRRLIYLGRRIVGLR